jgi:nucleoid DNA-binding protein
MQTVESHINALLFDNECVIVPGFGGFLQQKKSAHYDRVRNKLYPPGVGLSFNRKLQQNDGLLIHFVADQEKLNYEDAQKHVQEFVANLNSKVAQNESFRLHGLGLFFIKEQRIAFEPDRSLNFSKESYGLAHVFVPKFDLASPNSHEVKPNSVINHLHTSRKTRQNWKRVAVAASLFPIAAYLVWIPSKTGMLKEGYSFQTSDLNPFSEKLCGIYASRNHALSNIDFPDINEQVFSLTETSSINFTDKNEEGYVDREIIVVPTSQKVSAKNESALAHALHLPHQIIIGCFVDKSNAQHLIDEMQNAGINAFILDYHKGLHRVSAGGFASKNEAVEQQDFIRNSTQIGAWIFSK